MQLISDEQKIKNINLKEGLDPGYLPKEVVMQG